MLVNDVIEKNISNFNGWSLFLKIVYYDGNVSDLYDLEDFYMSNTNLLDYIVEDIYINFNKKMISILCYE